jgi:4a-hydroxytetrahydrobiopterin dehydratase
LPATQNRRSSWAAVRLSYMPEWITTLQFHEADGVDDWRVLGSGVSAYFRTESWSRGVELVDAIAKLAEVDSHRPAIDLRTAGITAHLHADMEHGLSRGHIELARQISAAARARGIAADPTAVQDVQITIDALVPAEVRPFWRAVLGYREVGDEDLLDPHSRGPSIWFQEMDEPGPHRNRIHVDIFVPHDQAEARIASALAAGGRLVSDRHAPAWWTLVDPEDNEVDVATWMGRD